MANFKEEYENYKRKYATYKEDKAVFDRLLSDLKSKMSKNLSKLDLDFLDDLGIDLTIDYSKLSDKEYLKAQLEKGLKAKDLLEKKGLEVLGVNN